MTFATDWPFLCAFSALALGAIALWRIRGGAKKRICSCGDWFTPEGDETKCWVCRADNWEDEDE